LARREPLCTDALSAWRLDRNDSFDRDGLPLRIYRDNGPPQRFAVLPQDGFDRVMQLGRAGSKVDFSRDESSLHDQDWRSGLVVEEQEQLIQNAKAYLRV
jgi:hypothetical protein